MLIDKSVFTQYVTYDNYISLYIAILEHEQQPCASLVDTISAVCQ